MADRRETQRQRREAREAAEQAALRAAARQRRIQFVAVGLLALVLVVGVAVVVIAGGGDDGPRTADEDLPTLPAQRTTDLAAAVKASGCVRRSHPIEGRQHEQRDFTAADYRTNPPTSGNHFPTWAQDGVYAAGTEPQLGQLVHTLEHGRIDVQYRADAPESTRRQLAAFVAENPYHMVLFRNPTGMEPLIAFTAWGQSLTCDAVGDGVWDAARAFRDTYVDKGPEKVP